MLFISDLESGLVPGQGPGESARSHVRSDRGPLPAFGQDTRLSALPGRGRPPLGEVRVLSGKTVTWKSWVDDIQAVLVLHSQKISDKEKQEL